MKKAAAILLMLVMLVTVPFSIYAEEPQSSSVVTLTLDDCISKALGYYSHQSAVFDRQIDSLWEQRNDLMELSNSVQQQLDEMERYKQLYDKRQKGIRFTIEEQNQFIQYTYMFGAKPPEYSSQEMFDNFIMNRDFPPNSLWAVIQNLKTSKEAAASSIKMGVKQLYDSIIDFQETLSLQQELYSNMKKQNEQMQTKYKKGLISEIDKYIADAALEKQKLSNEKLKRSFENLKFMLKQQIGLPLSQDIMAKPYDNSTGLKVNAPYAAYLDKALKNRAEILTAKTDLEVKQREDDIMKQYITSDFLTQRMEADQALEEKNIAYREAVNRVTADISSGYKDVLLKKSGFYISVGKQQNSEKKYKDAKLQYDKGLLSLANFWNVEIAYTQAKINCKKALRDYNNALYKLETAGGVGPGYDTNMGGN